MLNYQRVTYGNDRCYWMMAVSPRPRQAKKLMNDTGFLQSLKDYDKAGKLCGPWVVHWCHEVGNFCAIGESIYGVKHLNAFKTWLVIRTCYTVTTWILALWHFFFRSFRLDFPSVYDLVFVGPLNTAVRRMPWLAMWSWHRSCKSMRGG